MGYDKTKAVEVTIDGKEYAILPLCSFPDIKSGVDYKSKSDAVEDKFGLTDLFSARSLYEITNKRKYMLAKIKYGI